MYCNNCGSQLPDGAKFCQECGARQAFVREQQYQPDANCGADNGNRYNSWQDPHAEQQYNNVYTPPVPVQSKPLSMGWFNFIINVELLVGPIIGIIRSILVLIGVDLTGASIYTELYGSYLMSEINAVFEGIEFASMVGAWINIPLFIFAFFVRYRLANYYKDGPGLLSALYGFGIASSLLVSFIMIFTMPNIMWSAFVAVIAIPAGIVGPIVLMNVNKKYLERRRYLFEDTYY